MRIVHFLPWQMTVGGAQRMLALWDRYCTDGWDGAWIVCPPGPVAWRLRHTRIIQAPPPIAASRVASLRPDRVVYHDALDSYGRVEAPAVLQVHCHWRLRDPAPAGPPPLAAISVIDPPDKHPSWLFTPWRHLPPAVELDRYRLREHKDRSPLVCGIVGRLHPDKTPRSFLHRLARRGPPSGWRIEFIGAGLQSLHHRLAAAMLRNQVNVAFRGDVAPDQMPQVYQGLDAVLIPTDLRFGEGSPYAALEAMASGVPVAARDCLGLCATCGEAALYAAADDGLLDQLAALRDLGLRQELGRLGREQVERRGDARKHVAELDRLYRTDRPVVASILMPVRDTPARMIQEAWRSIQKQTYPYWELVLVNDGSSRPDTLEALEQIARDQRVRRLDLPPIGLGQALNRGLAACQAQWAARMDADDVMLPDRLQKQMDYLAQHPEVDILGGQIEIFPDERPGQTIGRTQHPRVVHWAVVRQEARRGVPWFLNHPTVIFRRDRILALGGYRIEKYCEDLELWIRALRAGYVIHNLPDVVVRYRRHGGQVTAQSGRGDIVRRVLQEAIKE